MTVRVNPNVFAAFSVDPVCINLPVIPVNNTIDPGTTTVNYLWDFGDGETSTLQDPVHTFLNGDYTVTLIAGNECDTDIIFIFIFIFFI